MGKWTLTDPLAVSETVCNSVISIVRDLASFTATEDIIELSRVRAQINRLAQADMEIALSLWDVTLYLQRKLTDLGTDDAAQ